MTSKTLLIVEDNIGLRESLSLEFQDRGYTVYIAECLKSIPEQDYAYAIVDMRLNGVSGLSVVEHLKNKNPHCKIVVLTGYGSISTAVETIKLGAINYLTKPADVDKIESALLEKPISLESPEQLTSLSRQEHEYIEYVLAQNNGNITKTAKALGLHRQSLQRKLKKRP